MTMAVRLLTHAPEPWPGIMSRRLPSARMMTVAFGLPVTLDNAIVLE